MHFNHKKKQTQSKDGMDKAISDKLVLIFPLRNGFIHRKFLYVDKSKGNNYYFVLFKVYNIDPGSFFLLDIPSERD